MICDELMSKLHITRRYDSHGYLINDDGGERTLETKATAPLVPATFGHAVLVRVTLDLMARLDPIAELEFRGRNAATGTWDPGTWSRFCDIISAVWENKPRLLRKGPRGKSSYIII